MAEPSLTKELDVTQLASFPDDKLVSLGLTADEITTLRSLPPTHISSMIPLVVAAGKRKAAQLQSILPYTPEVDVDGRRRCVYVDSKGNRCEHYGDKNTPVCKRHAAKAQSLGSYFQSPSLRQTYESFMSSPDKMKADGELALMRTMLATLLSKVNDDNLNIELIAGITTMSEKITQVVDRIAKIERITPEHLQNLMKKMVDIAADFIPADKLPEFAAKIEAINLNDSTVHLVDGIRYVPGEKLDGEEVKAVDESVIMQKSALLDIAAKMGVTNDA
jgi:hypothetical protein